MALALALTAAGPSCSRTLPPEGQVLLYVTTDAPMGPPGGLFDRMIVEVYPPRAPEPCPGCSRTFAVDDGRMAEGKASMGISIAPGTSGYRARVRLYRSGGTASGAPRLASTIERFVALPTIEREGVVEATVVMRLADLAQVRGSLEAPLPTDPGPAPPAMVGSVLAGRATTCASAAKSDEVCVPGSAFWMGNPRLDVLDAKEADGTSERVVLLSPFFIDRAEISVAQMRAARVARVVDDPVEANNSMPQCLYTASVGPSDALPVNCLSWQRARAYCAKVGKRLPSEAEYELVAGARESRAFGWGGDLPQCPDAVFDRDGVCPGPLSPQPAGQGLRDRVSIGGAEVVDLAGNLREFTLDRFRRGDEACWGSGVFVDPVCDRDSDDAVIPRTVRGGSYRDEATLLRAAQRTFLTDERFAVSELVGFRCARDGR